MKKLIALALSVVLAIGAFTGCGSIEATKAKVIEIELTNEEYAIVSLVLQIRPCRQYSCRSIGQYAVLPGSLPERKVPGGTSIQICIAFPLESPARLSRSRYRNKGHDTECPNI